MSALLVPCVEKMQFASTSQAASAANVPKERFPTPILKSDVSELSLAKLTTTVLETPFATICIAVSVQSPTSATTADVSHRLFDQ